MLAALRLGLIDHQHTLATQGLAAADRACTTGPPGHQRDTVLMIGKKAPGSSQHLRQTAQGECDLQAKLWDMPGACQKCDAWLASKGSRQQQTLAALVRNDRKLKSTCIHTVQDSAQLCTGQRHTQHRARPVIPHSAHPAAKKWKKPSTPSHTHAGHASITDTARQQHKAAQHTSQAHHNIILYQRHCMC